MRQARRRGSRVPRRRLRRAPGSAARDRRRRGRRNRGSRPCAARTRRRCRPSPARPSTVKDNGRAARRPRGPRSPATSLRPVISSMSLALVASFASSVAQVSPSRRTEIRSAIARTSSRRCETKRIPQPRARSAPMIWNSRSDSSPVSAAVGSSMTKMRARADSSSRKAAAILTSIRSPTGSFATIVFGREVLDAERGQRGAGARVERSPVDEAEAARIDAAEKDVLGDAEARDDVQLLMDESEAAPMRLLRAAERSRRAVDPDLAAVRREPRRRGS